MIKYNKISEDWIQIYGSYKGVSIQGAAYRVGSLSGLALGKTVWHYSVRILKHPKLWKVDSDPKSIFLRSERCLKECIEDLCEEFITNWSKSNNKEEEND